MPDQMSIAPDSPRLRRWRRVTVATLLVGYAGYYICRSNLSVAAPLLIAEFESDGLDRAAIGLISSAGVLAYAVGKLVTGVMGDFVGGRRLFLCGMIASVGATLVFGASSGFAVFVAAWMANRFVQSMGWGALVKVAAHWISPAQYGAVMAVLSLSYLFGDAVGRLLLGEVIAAGYGWRGVFAAAALALTAIAVACWRLLYDRPGLLGFAEPDAARTSVYGRHADDSYPSSIGDLLRPYFANRGFWLVVIMSFGLTLVRETFNAWIPTYLVDVHGFSQASAARQSSIFPFVGGLSVLAIGVASDRLRRHSRVSLALPFLALAGLSLLALGRMEANGPAWLPSMLIGIVAFLVIGPYSLLAGAMAVELGGKRGTATAAGLIDTAGYLGGLVSGYGIGRLVGVYGWPAAFGGLAIATFMATVAAVAYHLHHRRLTMVPSVAEAPAR